MMGSRRSNRVSWATGPNLCKVVSWSHLTAHGEENDTRASLPTFPILPSIKNAARLKISIMHNGVVPLLFHWFNSLFTKEALPTFFFHNVCLLNACDLPKTNIQVPKNAMSAESNWDDGFHSDLRKWERIVPVAYTDTGDSVSVSALTIIPTKREQYHQEKLQGGNHPNR